MAQRGWVMKIRSHRPGDFEKFLYGTRLDRLSQGLLTRVPVQIKLVRRSLPGFALNSKMGQKWNEPFDLIDKSEIDSIPNGKIVQFAIRSITSPTILSRLNKTYDFWRINMINNFINRLIQKNAPEYPRYCRHRMRRRRTADELGNIMISVSFISEISSGGSQEISVPAGVSSAVIFLTIGGNLTGKDELLKFKFDGLSIIGLVGSAPPMVDLGWLWASVWAKCNFVGLSVLTATCVLSNSILKK